MRRYRFASSHSTCEEVGIDGAGRYARKKSLVKQFRCPKTCPTMGSECPATHDFMSTGRQDTFSVKLAQQRGKLTAFARKYDTGVSIRRVTRVDSIHRARRRPYFFRCFIARSQIRNFRASLVQREFTSALLAHRWCSNASNELELHCLSAPIQSRVARAHRVERLEAAKKFFQRFRLALTKNVSGDAIERTTA